MSCTDCSYRCINPKSWPTFSRLPFFWSPLTTSRGCQESLSVPLEDPPLLSGACHAPLSKPSRVLALQLSFRCEVCVHMTQPRNQRRICTIYRTWYKASVRGITYSRDACKYPRISRPQKLVLTNKPADASATARAACAGKPSSRSAQEA